MKKNFLIIFRLKVEAALLAAASKSAAEAEPVPKAPPAGATSSPAAPNVNPKLKGISTSLIEKIRAKEAAKQQMAMLRNTDAEERLLRVSRLPQMVRILKAYVCICYYIQGMTKGLWDQELYEESRTI